MCPSQRPPSPGCLGSTSATPQARTGPRRRVSARTAHPSGTCGQPERGRHPRVEGHAVRDDSALCCPRRRATRRVLRQVWPETTAPKTETPQQALRPSDPSPYLCVAMHRRLLAVTKRAVDKARCRRAWRGDVARWRETPVINDATASPQPGKRHGLKAWARV